MKYQILDETKEEFGVIFHRIQALSDFGDVKRGEKGGWIEKEANLSQEGSAWIHDNARVSRNACVSEHARVTGNAWVGGRATVKGRAQVGENAWTSGAALICENARVAGNARISKSAWIDGHARISENAQISGDAWISGHAQIGGRVSVDGEAQVGGRVRIDGDTWISGDAYIKGAWDLYTFPDLGPDHNTVAFFQSDRGGILVTCGYFLDTLEEFLEAVANKHGENDHAKIYRLAAEIAQLRIGHK